MDLLAVAQTGDRLATLAELRDRLAADLDDCNSARDVSSLSQRLMDVLGQIDAASRASADKKGTPVDELLKRRAERLTGSSGNS